MSESTKINGTTVKYNTDGHNVCVIAKNSEISMENWIAELHKLDRSHYDTPASIQNCCCKSCNAARKQHGLTAKKWKRDDLRQGELKPVGMKVIDIENLIRMEIQGDNYI